MRRISILATACLILLGTPVMAQTEIGVSYELRDEDPKGGFGLRVQKGILTQVPTIDIGMRAHFSYFSDDNSVTDGAVTYSQELTNYDFGVAIIAGISVGLIEPYVGLGLGSETLELKPEEVVGISLTDENESNIYWNGIVGAKVPVIPLVKPFVEYRYSNNSISEPDVAELTTGRIIFGVSIAF